MTARIVDMNEPGISKAELDEAYAEFCKRVEETHESIFGHKPRQAKTHDIVYAWFMIIFFAFVLVGGWLSFENKRLSNTIQQLEINLDQARTALQLEVAQNQKILKHMANEEKKQ